ncbi:MAG: phosphoribosylamine--glycine ligase [Chloroflexi bacterium]|nr:phosphoribosylamine--glycine ligase [Chloroflexota bacterium]
MKILVVGSGAREHALVWKLARSAKVEEIYVAPGNAGTALSAHNINIDSLDIKSLAGAARERDIGLVVVGPEAPLAQGIVDYFQGAGIPIFGPTKAAAEIEASKVFAKELMRKYNIPCARSASFSDYGEAKDYLRRQPPPVVVKADGLAAGKGVVVADSIPQALEALSQFMVAKSLGAAGDRVLIEEYLSGREMSSFAFTDGDAVVVMPSACDYKRAHDGDRGPNTGGMGSYSPPHFYSDGLARTVRETILEPTVRAMAGEGRRYKGVLYGGLMVADNGPKALEFNARFGDPETQVILPLLKSDLVDVLMAVTSGTLAQVSVEWSDRACVGVVMASAGYPGGYRTGFPITGLDQVDEDVLVFHAGTKVGPGGEVVTAGGRVLTVVATGKTIAQARKKVYLNLPRIHFEGCHYRRDIAEIRAA